MKRIILLIISLLTMITCTNVFAKEVENTCTYGDGTNSIACDFYNDNSHQCKITSDKNNKEKFTNWGAVVGGGFNAKEWYKNNKKCLSHVVFLNATGYEIYGYSSYQDALIQQQDRKKFYDDVFLLELTSSNGKNEEEETEDEETKRKIEEYISTLKDIGTNFQLDDYCDKDEKGVYIVRKQGYEQSLCRSAKSAAYDTITDWDEYVKNAISSGKIPDDDPLVSEYEKLRNAARAALGYCVDCGDQEDPTDDPAITIVSPTPEETSYQSGEEGVCPLGPEVTKDLKGALKIFRIIAPILAIVLSTLDAIKAITKGDGQADLKKVAIRFGKRAIYAVLLFFIPLLIEILFSITGFTSGCDLDNPGPGSSGGTPPSVETPEKEPETPKDPLDGDTYKKPTITTVNPQSCYSWSDLPEYYSDVDGDDSYRFTTKCYVKDNNGKDQEMDCNKNPQTDFYIRIYCSYANKVNELIKEYKISETCNPVKEENGGGDTGTLEIKYTGSLACHTTKDRSDLSNNVKLFYDGKELGNQYTAPENGAELDATCKKSNDKSDWGCNAKDGYLLFTGTYHGKSVTKKFTINSQCKN